MGETQTYTLPRTERKITVAAEALGLQIPEACMAGVMTNLAFLASHADILLGRSETR